MRLSSGWFIFVSFILLLIFLRTKFLRNFDKLCTEFISSFLVGLKLRKFVILLIDLGEDKEEKIYLSSVGEFIELFLYLILSIGDFGFIISLLVRHFKLLLYIFKKILIL